MEDLSKKYDERTIRLIIETLVDEGIDFDSNFDESVCDEIDDALKYIGINPKNWEDYSFYIQLVKINPNYETENIKVPELNKYAVDIDATLYETAIETWRHKIYSYFDNKDMIKQQVGNHPDYTYWEGEMVHRDVHDSSTESEYITNVQRIEYRYNDEK